MMKRRNFLKRFSDLEKDDLLVDLHIHSKWTDGKQSIEEIVKTAKMMHLSAIALSDHVRQDSTYCMEYNREISRISRESGFKIIAGFEAKVLNARGDLDLPSYCRRGKHLIIGCVHSVPFKRKTVHPKNIPADEFQDLELKYSLAIIKGGKADILGHAGGMSIGNHGGFSIDYFERIISSCGKGDTAFEINSKYHGKHLKEIWKMLSYHNPFVSFGSDAHSRAEIGNCIRMVCSLI